MNREEAESERNRMAAEHPEATWLVAEREPGEWAVVKVGLAPVDGPDGTATPARPRPTAHTPPATVPRFSAEM
jgi:hypothetical protein